MSLYTKRDVASGCLIYPTGDTIAAVLLSQFSFTRLVGIAAVGALLYSIEIPHYFGWIDRTTKEWNQRRARWTRMALAIAYFNPLWIARHLLFIKIFSGNVSSVNWSLLSIAGMSFLVNVPISLAANYLIQNVIPLRWRFIASAAFSALMAVYYAVSMVVFGEKV